MKTYSYSGYTAEGGKAEGLIEALNLKAAREGLIAKGVYAKHISDVEVDQHRFKQSRLKASHRSQIYRELSILLLAGNDVDRSIALLQETAEFQSVSMALAKLRDDLRSGHTFSAVIHSISTRWRGYESAILEVGESTGTLSKSMNTLADFLEDEEIFAEQTKTALLYPVLILAFSLVIVGVCSFWLLPLFETTLQEAGLRLSIWTGVLMGLGKVLSLGSLVLILAGAMGAPFMKAFFRRDRVLSAWERTGYRVPGLTSFLQSIFTYRFCRTYAALLDGGVLLVDAFPLAVRSSGSTWLRLAAEGSHEELKKGDSLANVLSRLPWISHSVSGWVRAGEESGAVSDMFLHAGERAKRQSNRLRERGLALLEPLMIILIGMFILGLSLAVLGPIMTLNESLLQ